MLADDDVVIVGKLGPNVEVTFGVVLPVVGGFWSWAKATSGVVVITNATPNTDRITTAINARPFLFILRLFLTILFIRNSNLSCNIIKATFYRSIIAMKTKNQATTLLLDRVG